MIQKAERRESEENVDQAIVSNDSQQRLFVVQGVCPDDFGRPIWDADCQQVRPRQDAIEGNEDELIFGPTGSLDEVVSVVMRRLTGGCRTV